MKKAGKAIQRRGRDDVPSFLKGEEGDTSAPILSSPSPTPVSVLSSGLLPLLPDTLPWLHSIYGSKSCWVWDAHLSLLCPPLPPTIPATSFKPGPASPPQ